MAIKVMGMIDIGDFADQVGRLARYHDALFCRDPRKSQAVRDYWIKDLLRRKHHEKNPFWEQYEIIPNDLDELHEELLGVLKEKPPQFFDLDEEKIPFWDCKKINDYLDKYFYYCGKRYGGKLTFLLGEADHKKVDDLDIYTISKEFVCTLEITSPAFYAPTDKIIVGRKYSKELLLWNKVNTLRWNRLRRNAEQKILEIGLTALTDLSLEDLLEKTAEIELNIKKAAELELGASEAHEIGHSGADKYLPYSTSLKLINTARKMDYELEAFISGVEDLLADSICEGKIVGTLGYINKLDKSIKTGFLSLYTYNKMCSLEQNSSVMHPVLVEGFKLEREWLPAFYEFLTTGDGGIMEDLRAKFEKRGKGLCKEISGNQKIKIPFLKDFFTIRHLRKVKTREEEEYKKIRPKIKDVLSKLENLKTKEIVI